MGFASFGLSRPGALGRRKLRLESLEDRRLLVADIETDLIGFWKLDETAIGQDVLDASSLGNDGMHAGIMSPQGPNPNTAIDEGVDSRSLQVDGIDDFVRIAPSGSFDFPSGQFTLSAWFNSAHSDSEFHGLLGYDPGSVVNRGPSIWIFGQTRIHGGFGDGVNWNSFITDPVLVPNEFNHVVTTFDGTVYRAYVNGALVLATTEYAGRMPVSAAELNIGRVDNHFGGLIDHVRIYSRALAAEDVAALFEERNENPPPEPVDGLVGHWKLDEPTLGAAVQDASGLGNLGVHVNLTVPQGPSTNIAVDEGPTSRSLFFDGVDDYVLIAGNTTLDLSAGPFSQSLWILPTTGNIGFHGVLGLENGLTGRAPSIWVLDNDRLHAGFGDGTSFHSLVTPSVLNVGAWNHVATTYDGATYRLYVDGVEISALAGFSGQSPLAQTTLNIGRVDNYFQGGVDDVRIFARALDNDEVLTLAQLQPPPPPPPPPQSGLVGHWRLDEQTIGQAAVEETGVSQPGIPVNFTPPFGPNGDVAVASGAAGSRSLHFDGVDDYLQINNSPGLDPSGGQFTQSVWIKPNLTDDGFHGVLGHHSTLVERAPSIWVYEQTRIHVGFGDGTNWNSLITSSILEADAWNHVVVTYDAAAAYRIYHNGRLVHTTTAYAGRVPVPSSRLDIGRVDNYFAGLIDDVRIYNRSLSGDEVEQLFSSVQSPGGTVALEKAKVFVDESAGTAQVRVTRTPGSSTVATVDYSILSGTASPGSDFVQANGQVVFQPGETSALITIQLLDDLDSEGTESFGVAIDSVDGASLGSVRTTNIKIFDNESPLGPTELPVVVLTDTSFEITEDAGQAVITVFRAGSTAGPVIVAYVAHAGTAIPGVDFLSVSGFVEVPPGERLGSFSVPILNDAEGEPNETVQINLFTIAGGVFGVDTQAELVIIDDDPGDFVQQTVVSTLNEPTSFDFFPDGRILIATKPGRVRVANGGVLLPTPFIDLSSEVNSSSDRGLLGLAVHPNFPQTPFVYLLYVYDPPETTAQSGLAAPDQAGNRVSRLLRVAADPATNFATALPGSEIVLLGSNSIWENISHPELNGTEDVTLPPSCGTGSTLDDCLPVDSQSHTVGLVAFGPDGALYVSTGDNSSFGRVDPRAIRAQDVNTLAGKILRIDPLTGSGLTDNPFFDPAAPNSNRSKVYSYGLRHPFRFALHPQTSEPFIGDVGWNNWEEIDTGAGANFGWPFFEGGNGVPLPTNGYQDLPEAQAFYASGEPTVPAIFARSHASGAISLTMGDFYTGATYPSLYHNALFYADFLEGTVDTLILDAQGAVAQIRRFADATPGIVQMKMGPDENMYFLDFFTGSVKRFAPAAGAGVARPTQSFKGIGPAAPAKRPATSLAPAFDLSVPSGQFAKSAVGRPTYVASSPPAGIDWARSRALADLYNDSRVAKLPTSNRTEFTVATSASRPDGKARASVHLPYTLDPPVPRAGLQSPLGESAAFDAMAATVASFAQYR